MSPEMRQLISIVIVVACLVAAGFVFTHGGNPGAGIGGAIGGVVAVLLVNARARRQRS